MAKLPIDFNGASYSKLGSSCTVLPDGTRKNEVQHRRIILADGTQYEFNRYGWNRWMVNKYFRCHPDSRGHYRKCNDRYSWLLDQAWEENFKESANE